MFDYNRTPTQQLRFRGQGWGGLPDRQIIYPADSSPEPLEGTVREGDSHVLTPGHVLTPLDLGRARLRNVTVPFSLDV